MLDVNRSRESCSIIQNNGISTSDDQAHSIDQVIQNMIKPRCKRIRAPPRKIFPNADKDKKTQKPILPTTIFTKYSELEEFQSDIEDILSLDHLKSNIPIRTPRSRRQASQSMGPISSNLRPPVFPRSPLRRRISISNKNLWTQTELLSQQQAPQPRKRRHSSAHGNFVHNTVKTCEDLNILKSGNSSNITRSNIPAIRHADKFHHHSLIPARRQSIGRKHHVLSNIPVIIALGEVNNVSSGTDQRTMSCSILCKDNVSLSRAVERFRVVNPSISSIQLLSNLIDYSLCGLACIDLRYLNASFTSYSLCIQYASIQSPQWSVLVADNQPDLPLGRSLLQGRSHRGGLLRLGMNYVNSSGEFHLLAVLKVQI